MKDGAPHPMPRRLCHGEDQDFQLTVERVPLPPSQQDKVVEGIRILATWLLRHHRKMIRTPKRRSELPRNPP